jgi:hypothetical protein
VSRANGKEICKCLKEGKCVKGMKENIIRSKLKGSVLMADGKEKSYVVLDRKCFEAYGKETSYVIIEMKCVDGRWKRNTILS